MIIYDNDCGMCVYARAYACSRTCVKMREKHCYRNTVTLLLLLGVNIKMIRNV